MHKTNGANSHFIVVTVARLSNWKFWGRGIRGAGAEETGLAENKRAIRH
jgi:hypothetical protein